MQTRHLPTAMGPCPEMDEPPAVDENLVLRNTVTAVGLCGLLYRMILQKAAA